MLSFRNLDENLISLNHIIENNYIITFDKFGATVHRNNSTILYIKRSPADNRWKIDIEDLKRLMGSIAHENKSQQIINAANSARLHEDEKSTVT
jgi:hypothetical protein